MSAANAEILRLEPLRDGKHDAAELSKQLEDSIATKTSQIALKNTMLTDTTANNANIRTDASATHAAELGLLEAEIAFLEGNATTLQGVYDKFTAQHSSTSCEEKKEKGETICKRCLTGENPCHDECISSDMTCHKDPGCACAEAASALTEAASKAQGSARHNSALKAKTQSDGEGEGEPDPVEGEGDKESDSASHHSAKVADADLHNKLQQAKQQYGEAIASENQAIRGLAASLELNKRSTEEAQSNKAAAVATFDETIEGFEKTKEELEVKKIAAEEKLKKAKEDRDKVVKDTGDDINKLKVELYAEIERLHGQALKQTQAKGTLIVTHNSNMGSLQDAHDIAENGLRTDIKTLEDDKAALQGNLDAISTEHGITDAGSGSAGLTDTA